MVDFLGRPIGLYERTRKEVSPELDDRLGKSILRSFKAVTAISLLVMAPFLGIGIVALLAAEEWANEELASQRRRKYFPQWVEKRGRFGKDLSWAETVAPEKATVLPVLPRVTAAGAELISEEISRSMRCEEMYAHGDLEKYYLWRREVQAMVFRGGKVEKGLGRGGEQSALSEWNIVGAEEISLELAVKIEKWARREWDKIEVRRNEKVEEHEKMKKCAIEIIFGRTDQLVKAS